LRGRKNPERNGVIKNKRECMVNIARTENSGNLTLNFGAVSEGK
jgi:hypothetical protein